MTFFHHHLIVHHFESEKKRWGYHSPVDSPRHRRAARDGGLNHNLGASNDSDFQLKLRCCLELTILLLRMPRSVDGRLCTTVHRYSATLSQDQCFQSWPPSHFLLARDGRLFAFLEADDPWLSGSSLFCNATCTWGLKDDICAGSSE